MFSRKCKARGCRRTVYRTGLCRRCWEAQPRGTTCQWPGCREKIRGGAKFCTPHAKAAWKKNNPDKVQAARAARRARENKAASEAISKARVWARDRGICGICGKKADKGNWHLDHVIPLSRGGTHTYGNVQVSHPFCNWKKGAKILVKAA